MEKFNFCAVTTELFMAMVYSEGSQTSKMDFLQK